MNSKLRAVARYWFVAPLLFLAVGLQMGLGFVAVTGPSATLAFNSVVSPASPTELPSPTFRPTFTATPAPSATPTPSPTFTATPTPTSTPDPTFTPPPTFTASPPPPLLPESPSTTPTPWPTSTSTVTPTPELTPIAADVAWSIPILMYHYLSKPPADANVIRRDLSVTPDQFEAHLAYLRQVGYETISLNQLAQAAAGQTGLPPKPIIITFDDGYRDNYENAFPLLQKYGYTATFFVFTQPIDTNNVNYLSWEMVKEMHQAGMEFGSHSYSHADLRGRSVDFLVYEIVGSKEAIEARINEPVRFFCYPSGRYDDLTIKVLESAHFWGAVTTEWGINQSFDHRFELKRLRMRGGDTADTLAAKLAF